MSTRRGPKSGAVFGAKQTRGTTATAALPNVKLENSSGAISAGNPFIHGQPGFNRSGRCTNLATKSVPTTGAPRLSRR